MTTFSPQSTFFRIDRRPFRGGWFVLIFAVFLGLASGFSRAADARIVTVAVDAEFAPYEFSTMDGEVRGMAPDILRAIGKQNRIVFRFVPMNWSQAVEALHAGRVDLVQMIRTQARVRRFVFSEPFIQLTQALFRRKGSGLTGLSDLSGRRVALQRHDIADELLRGQNDFLRVPVNNKSQGFELLDMGKVDGFFAAELPGHYLLRSGRYPQVELAQGGLFPMSLCFTARKDDALLIQRINGALERLRKQGVLAAIERKWRDAGPSKETHLWEPLIFLSGLAALFLVVIIMAKWSPFAVISSRFRSAWPHVIRHAWAAIFLLCALGSLALYQRMHNDEKRLLHSEIAHRSQNKLTNARLFIEQHIDAARGLAAYLDSEIILDRSAPSGADNLRRDQERSQEEIRGNALALLHAHPGEIMAVTVLMGRDKGQAVTVVQGEQIGTELDPPLEMGQLADLAPGEAKMRLSIGSAGQKLLRVYLATHERPLAYVVVDLDATDLLVSAVTENKPAGLDVEVWVHHKGRIVSLLRHVSRSRDLAPAPGTPFDWTGVFVAGGLRFEMATRASPVLTERFLSHRPHLLMVLGLLLSGVITLIVYRRARYGERLRAEVSARTAELAAEQNKLAAIIEHAREGVLLADGQGNILLANPAASELFGYGPGELNGLSITDLVAGAIPGSSARRVSAVLGAAGVYDMGQTRVAQAQHKDGTLFPCEITVSRFEEREETRLSVILRDISTRHYLERNREALLEIRGISQQSVPQDRRLQLILDAMFGEDYDLPYWAGVLFVADGETLRMAACHGFGEWAAGQQIQIPRGECLCGRAFADRCTLCLAYQPDEERSLLKELGSGGHLCMPIRHGEQRLGLIVLALHPDTPVPDLFYGFLEQVEEVISGMLLRDRDRLALEESETVHRTLVESTPLGIVIHERGIIRYANPAIVRMLGFDQAGPLLDANFMDWVTEESRSAIEDYILRVGGQDGNTVLMDAKLLRADGSPFWTELRSTPTTFSGRSASQLLIQDISERKAAESRLQWLSYYDDLTGLPNRRLFNDRLQQAIMLAQRHDHPLAVLYIDLDRFKFINDTMGHAIGDRVLAVIGERLRDGLRDADSVARLGGDEFAVLLPESSRQAALAVAEKLYEFIVEPCVIDNHEFMLEGSIGIAAFPEDGADIETLLKHADTAMYHAKTHHTHLHCFSGEMAKKVSRRLSLEQELAKAIDTKTLEAVSRPDCFSLYYQGKYWLAGGAPDTAGLLGVEALLRWRHPQGEEVSPAEFIPMAEETGMILPLTRWLLEEAARQAAWWEAQGVRPGPIGLNISPVKMMRRDMAETMLDIIARHGAQPEWFEVEITETAMMLDPELATSVTRKLADAGMSVAIDDFGTGYSSLAYLKQFPVDWLKIDIAFVRDLPHSTENTAIVRSIIAMAHAMGIKVLAEGVESNAQLEFLANEGCDAVQGFLTGRPCPGSGIADLVRSVGLGRVGQN